MYDRIIFDKLEAFDLTKKNWKLPFYVKLRNFT